LHAQAPDAGEVGDQVTAPVDPFLITGPAVISFSGGRTSAYMLWRILQAHGGMLPDDVLVCFANTGREMPATLDFVRDCGAAWNVPIRWLEYSRTAAGPTVITVSHNSASRNGEPFETLLRAKSMLPNPVSRFCTIELKIRTAKRYVRSLGWSHWTNIIGLRADEPGRVARALDRERTRKDRWHNACPLAEAGIAEIDVLRFWRSQPFDLRLRGAWEGNCDGCFLKNRAGLQRMWVDHPGRMDWWQRMEAMPHGLGAGGTFRADREDYATMARTMRDQGRLPFDLNEAALPCDEAGCGV
jgi:3'-phosphoadenosine 5'-phosphosulfate sulfotransferase (PAPS reductase)/FAD synthetase